MTPAAFVKRFMGDLARLESHLVEVKSNQAAILERLERLEAAQGGTSRSSSPAPGAGSGPSTGTGAAISPPAGSRKA